MVLPKEEKDVDPKKERDMKDHVPTIDLISRINNVQVSSNYPISAFVNFFDILIYFQSGFIGKKRGGATAYRLGRTKRGSTTGGKGIKQECNSFLRQSLFILSLSGHGDGKEVWWGKTEVPAEDKVSSCYCNCWISWMYKTFFSGPIFTWGKRRNHRKKERN